MDIDTSNLNPNDWMNVELSTGTSIMAVEFDGGVVIGADTRTTTGSYIASRLTDKLTKITDKIFCCRSGSAADTQAVAEIVAYHLEFYSTEMGEEPLVETAAAIFREMCYTYRGQLMAGIIVAGWDSVKGGQVYDIPLGGMIIRERVSMGGSGSSYVLGYIDANYKPNMPRDECIKLVSNTLTLAMSRDGSSGGMVRLGVIEDGKPIQRSTIPGNKLVRFYAGE